LKDCQDLPHDLIYYVQDLTLLNDTNHQVLIFFIYSYYLDKEFEALLAYASLKFF